MLSILIVAAYLVALLCDKKALTLLFAVVCCEFIGNSPLFLWTHHFYYGMLSFTAWGVIYAMYVLLENAKGRLRVACVMMVLFQTAMSVDSWVTNGAKTNLYISYEYVLVLIHCYIISSFITRGSIIRLLGYIASIIRIVINRNVLNLVFWYTMVISKETIKAKSWQLMN
jgi:hypothetical protein